jgi:hypothetical protein
MQAAGFAEEADRISSPVPASTNHPEGTKVARDVTGIPDPAAAADEFRSAHCDGDEC